MSDILKLLRNPEANLTEILNNEILEFKEWAKNRIKEWEWETNYPNWININTVFERFLKLTNFKDWDNTTLNNILYIIGRDNECETLIRDVYNICPDALIHLAKKGIYYSDSDTKWQLAHYVAKLFNDNSEVEEIVFQYFQDTDEYVKRRALIALGEIKSRFVEKCALEAWHHQYEYQRLVSLDILYKLQSSFIDKLIEEGENDKSELVRQKIKEIRKGC